ncbi:TerD family protein [Streptomyces syringium]|uniref:TerD family protein n=1 Tax=Streptomyces syringium TaxID=76729 RepID=UPI003D905248
MCALIAPVRDACVRALGQGDGSESTSRTSKDVARRHGGLQRGYRYGGEWKFRAVGQGYASGLCPTALLSGADTESGHP